MQLNTIHQTGPATICWAGSPPTLWLESEDLEETKRIERLKKQQQKREEEVAAKQPPQAGYASSPERTG